MQWSDDRWRAEVLIRLLNVQWSLYFQCVYCKNLNLFCKLFKGIWKIKGVGEKTEGGRGTKKERGRRVVQRCGETRKGPENKSDEFNLSTEEKKMLQNFYCFEENILWVHNWLSALKIPVGEFHILTP